MTELEARETDIKAAEGDDALFDRVGNDAARTRDRLTAALEQCARWRASGYEMSVAVNLSPAQFKDLSLTVPPSGLRCFSRSRAAC